MSESSKSSRRNRKRATRRRVLLAAVLVLLTAAGAGVWYVLANRVDTDALMADARSSFESGEYVAAVINLKNVLGKESSNREARLLLGRAYLAAGDPAGAAKELARARELGESGDTLNRELTRAQILSGKFDEAATELAIHGDTSAPEWLILRGMLDLGQQRLDDARTTFRTVLDSDPGNDMARRGLMQAELAAGNAELARGEIDALVEAGAMDADLWQIKGELELYSEQHEAARDAFAKALELAPESPVARIGLARALLALGELDLATNALDAIGPGSVDDPRVSFVRAGIAEQRGDRHTALRFLNKVLQVAPMHRDSLVAAARLQFANGEYSRAGDYVSRILELEPGNAVAQRMLGAIQLASGRLDGLSGIGQANLPDPAAVQDPAMLALLGTAYLKHGRVEDGRESLERAAELAPDSLPIRTQLALSRLSAGEADEAIAELNAIIEEDPSFVQAEIMLALAYLARKDGDKALEKARDLRERHPDSALAFNVDGFVNEVLDNDDAARASYQAAVDRDPAFHPARMNLARLAAQAGDVDAARAHFDSMLEIQPFQPMAMQGLAALALQQDDLDEAERLWELAREHNPDAVGPRLMLAKHYRAKDNKILAEATVREAYKLAPYAPQVQAEFASLMLQLGKYEDALEAANALTARAPDSLPGLELLAQIYNQLGDADGLERTLERIAEIAPDAAPARVLLGRLALRRRDIDGARQIAAALKTDEETAALGHELDGDIAMSRDEPENAVAAYARAFELRPTSSNVIKLDQIERGLGRAADRLSRWLEEHPDDMQVRLIHASYLQQEGDGADAIGQYEKMLDTQGNNPIVLNNLAWLYHEAGDPRALELAQRAHELAPQQAEIIDTYGWILFRSGQRERALELITKARSIAPENPDIAYHLAEALSASGDDAQARSTLKTLLDEHPEFPARAEAESLQAKLATP